MPILLQENSISFKNLRGFIIAWDNKFPFDLWFRKKYNIAFNSSAHREMCLIDEKITYIENKLMEDISNKEEKKDKNSWLNPQEKLGGFSKEELEIAYDNLDLSQFND